MKKETFKRKDGSEGHKHTLQPGDEFTPRFNTPRETKAGKYTNYSLGIKDKQGNDMFINITEGQAKQLKILGDIEGKELKAYEYENQYGKQVGITLKQ